MYTPSILATPLRSTGAADPSRPGQANTSEWSFLDGQVQIGIWECTAGVLDEPTGDFDVAMFMVAGRATVTHSDSEVYDLVPGTLWTTPRNWASSWVVHQTIRKMYVIDHRDGAPALSTYMANAYTADVGDGTPRADPIAGTPVEASVSLWVHGHLDAGVWQCTPGEFRFRRDGYQEVFCVLSGHATLHIDNGPSFELVPGAMILTPSAVTGRWVVHETLRKAYVVITDG
jgi:uncharacterized protein